jgi:hypothetical protein
MNTKNKKCEFYMDEFLKLDKNDRLPLSLTIHLLLCKECRTIVRNLTLADQACKASMNKTVDSYDPSVTAIMKSINPEYQVKEMQPLSLTRWIVSGIVMIIAMLFFGITEGANNSQLSLSFYLVFAGIVTAYCAMFVGCNMDFFVKHINKFAQ